jgi:hypothetical protein
VCRGILLNLTRSYKENRLLLFFRRHPPTHVTRITRQKYLILLTVFFAVSFGKITMKLILDLGVPDKSEFG